MYKIQGTSVEDDTSLKQLVCHTAATGNVLENDEVQETSANYVCARLNLESVKSLRLLNPS